MSVTLEKQHRPRGCKESKIIVKDNGMFSGFIRKFDDDKFTTCPWQAFAPPPNRLLGTFYQAEGYKKAALQAVIDNKGTP